MDISSRIAQLADSLFTAYGSVAPENLLLHPEIRSVCEGNSCRCYNTCWACPPAVGTLEECQLRIRCYNRFLLLTKVYPFEDSFDYERMKAGLLDFKDTMDDFHSRIQPFTQDFLLLSNEGCGRCSVCTWPDAPCRFPDKLHHSLEGYGFLVSELAQCAGIPYNFGRNTVAFFGALLFNE